MSRRAGRRAGRGALFLLAIFLASSGALRIGSGLGEAVALAADENQPPAPEPSACQEPPLALATALNEREAQITTREAAIEERLAALALADQAIEKRLLALTTAEERLAATLALADGAAEQDLARLTEVYEAMKPKDAATLFTAMAPEFAAGFLGRMRPDAAGPILSGMPADTAYAISLLLAARNANAPTK